MGSNAIRLQNLIIFLIVFMRTNKDINLQSSFFYEINFYRVVLRLHIKTKGCWISIYPISTTAGLFPFPSSKQHHVSWKASQKYKESRERACAISSRTPKPKSLRVGVLVMYLKCLLFQGLRFWKGRVELKLVWEGNIIISRCWWEMVVHFHNWTLPQNPKVKQLWFLRATIV